MLTLAQSMELAGACHLAWLDPERGFMPTGGYEVAHDVGRWWDAMLRLEEATGFVIPADLEGAMLRNLQTLTDNPDGLLMNSPDVPWLADNAYINPHNFREGLLAFGTLVRRRDSRWARHAGLKLLGTLQKCLTPGGWLDYTRLECWGKVPFTADETHHRPPEATWFDMTASTGRALEAIAWFYEATGEALALEVAEPIARHHLERTVNPDGSARQEVFSPDSIGHNHSYLGTLRGLVLFGLLTGQHEYVDAVAATYHNSLWENNVTESGWTPHDLGKSRFPNEAGDPVAETASCGDVAQLALWLALQTGQHELLDDVERLVRARILPAQILTGDRPGLTPRDVGSWGVNGAPYGKGNILDVAAAVLHTLADVHQHTVTSDAHGLRVNLHLTYKGPEAQVISIRGADALLTVTPRVSGHVLIRVPRWVPGGSVTATVGGQDYAPVTVGQRLLFRAEDLPAGAEIVLRHPLPERETTERFRSGREYRLRWRGDGVIGISPHDGPMTIYPPMEGM